MPTEAPRRPRREWLTPELVSTDAALTRMHAWLAAGEPQTDADDVVQLGDRRAQPIIRRVFERLPAPVRWYATQRLAIVATGVVAWSTAAPLELGPRRLLVLGPFADERALRFEVARAWLSGKDAPPAAPLSETELERRRDAAVLLANQLGRLPILRDNRARYRRAWERFDELADELARGWALREIPAEQAT